MDICLMLGNGINRCLKKDISWDDLLNDIAKEYHVNLKYEMNFPMKFEVLANNVSKQERNFDKDIHIELKKKIISKLDSGNFQKNELYDKLLKITDNIITTNYDFYLEYSLNDKFNKKYNKEVNNNSNNNKYNLNNFTCIDGKHIYHIHGSITNANSICLGYEHYIGTVQKLRDKIASKKEDKPKIICYLENHDDKSIDEWAKIFFTKNIHIIGLGLTESEIDIWWLITYRAYLYYSNKFNGRNLIKNSIVFHEIGIKKDENLEFLLNNCAIKYEFHKIYKERDEQYLKMYYEIINSIEKEL